MQVLYNQQTDEELRQLAALASAVLTEHVSDHEVCAVCRCAWPCDRVILADHNLAVV
jgi:hypothetical protein